MNMIEWAIHLQDFVRAGVHFIVTAVILEVKLFRFLGVIP